APILMSASTSREENSSTRIGPATAGPRARPATMCSLQDCLAAHILSVTETPVSISGCDFLPRSFIVKMAFCLMVLISWRFVMHSRSLITDIVFLVPLGIARSEQPGDDVLFYRLVQHIRHDAKQSEFALMLRAILSGSMMGQGDGWFKPAESRYD